MAKNDRFEKIYSQGAMSTIEIANGKSILN